MSLTFQEKETLVSSISQVASKAITSVVLDYRGLTANEMNELRLSARRSGVVLQVAKNTLVQRALQGTLFKCFDQKILKGPTLITFSQDDPGAPARLVDAFMKDHPKLVVKAISIEGSLLGPEQLKAVTELPTYEKAVAMLMSTLKAPIVQLARTLKEPYAECVRALAALGQQKQS